MYKCKVCGKEFELKAENKYLTEGVVGLALVNLFALSSAEKQLQNLKK